MLSKSDFLIYNQTPMHLWAKAHDKLEITEAIIFEKYLIDQGNEVEKLAEQFILDEYCEENPDYTINFQQTYIDNPFVTRIDAGIYDPVSNLWDIVEIKSSSSVRKDDIFDLTYSLLVCEASIKVRNTYLVHLNKDYQFEGELVLKDLFLTTDITKDVKECKNIIKNKMGDAYRIINLASPEGITKCLKPKQCPCMTLCHPNLPEYPIFDIPFISKNKVFDLIDHNILSMKEIPGDYPLSNRQKQHIKTVIKGNAHIDRKIIKEIMASPQYPLYFLDYETYNPGIPKIKGFKPYQHTVFQFSLHLLKNIDGALLHAEFLADKYDNPEPAFLTNLSEQIGWSGSVIVWNKAFEAARNKELAVRYPQYVDFLHSINSRMFDLMEVFHKGHYIHPDFHGSYSIKNVLPILVPELNHSELHVSQGLEAMTLYHDLTIGAKTNEQIEEIRDGLLRYCELDTLALVEIWRVLNQV